MTDWYVEYRDPHDKDKVIQSSRSNTRELAIRAACELKRQNCGVIRAVGPVGEVVELPEIERRYDSLRVAGKLI